MALTRKANPLIDVGSGLVVIAATSAVGVLLPSLLLKAGDAWSSWVLQASTGGQFASRLTSVLTLSGASPAVVVVLGIVAIIISAVQAVLMLFRQGALVVLAGVLPLAAAGMLTPATRTWFRRVTGWMLALIFYKPAAAAVYATAFTMIGAGKDTRTVLMGFAMVFLSLLALPVLMRLFSWTTGHVADSAAGGGFLQTALGGAVAIGACAARRADRAVRVPSSKPASCRPGSARRIQGRAAPQRRAPESGTAAAPADANAGTAPGAATASAGTGSRRHSRGASRRRRCRAGGRSSKRPPQGNRGHPAAGCPVTATAMSQHDTHAATELRRVAPPARHRAVRARGRGHARGPRRPAGPDHRGDGRCGCPAVCRPADPGGRGAGRDPDRRRAAGAGRGAAAALVARFGAALHPVPGRGRGRARPRRSRCPESWPR